MQTAAGAFHDALVAAHANGRGYRSLARELGLDYTRVRELIKGQRRGVAHRHEPTHEELLEASGAPRPPDWQT
jgi:hypothetical protein